MNTVEMIKALDEGHKIRNTKWNKDYYIHKKNDVIVDSNDIPKAIMSFNDNWEIYIEDNRIELHESIKHFEDFYKAAKELSLKNCYDGPCRECPFRITSDDLIKAFDSKCFIFAIDSYLHEVNTKFKLDGGRK